MVKALVFGTKDCAFESHGGRKSRSPRFFKKFYFFYFLATGAIQGRRYRTFVLNWLFSKALCYQGTMVEGFRDVERWMWLGLGGGLQT